MHNSRCAHARIIMQTTRWRRRSRRSRWSIGVLPCSLTARLLHNVYRTHWVRNTPRTVQYRTVCVHGYVLCTACTPIRFTGITRTGLRDIRGRVCRACAPIVHRLLPDRSANSRFFFFFFPHNILFLPPTWRCTSCTRPATESAGFSNIFQFSPRRHSPSTAPSRIPYVRVELIGTTRADNEPPPPRTWLHARNI